jgi:hypothetical protein
MRQKTVDADDSISRKSVGVESSGNGEPFKNVRAAGQLDLERSRRKGELPLNVLKKEEGPVAIEQLQFPFRDVSA